MTASTATELRPQVDVYLTDGKKLWQVCGIDAKGNYNLEDVVTEEVLVVEPCVMTSETFTVVRSGRRG